MVPYGVSSKPIADYGLLSDCRSAALVARDGSIDWWAPRRFDRPSIFARLLDDDAGYWRIAPAGEATSERRYADRTLILETTFATPTGELVLTDGLGIGPNPGGHDLGSDPPHALLRLVECRSGLVDVDFACVPRPEYGIVEPMLQSRPDGIVAYGGPDTLFLTASMPLEIRNCAATTRFRLAQGERRAFALRHRFSEDANAPQWSDEDIYAEIERTRESWQRWSGLHQSYRGPWEAAVHHSGRVLQSLTYAPTGAMVAAPTTSLPEVVGGARNWDYRFVWVRDASLTMDALWIAACRDEAERFFDWLARVAAGRIREHGVSVMFGIGGEHDLQERELPHLRGYRGSTPVRVGNDAWKQRQIDVYGELLGAAQRYARELGTINEPARTFLIELADTALAVFSQTDHGIWETRGEPRHFTYSKVMCWAALDAAIALAPQLACPDRVAGWVEAKDRMADEIRARAWNPRLGAYGAAYDGDDLDASVLLMAVVGFAPATDDRMRATIATIARELADERGLVRRYRSVDGLEGSEGAFLLCTFWLAHAQALADDVEAARATFARAAACANDLGLFAEEVDAATGDLLGNFPQAFSHVGFVNAAYAISQAEERRANGSNAS